MLCSDAWSLLREANEPARTQVTHPLGEDVVMTRLHADELSVDDGVVRDLLRRDFPQHSSAPLTRVDRSGSSNALFRLGSDLLVRLPRQPGGGSGIEKEVRWLPYVAPRVSVSVPEVLGVGQPGFGYPERWSVTTWLDGDRATPPSPAAGTRTLALDLARFVAELRAMEPPARRDDHAQLRWYRGLPLTDLDEDFRASVDECRALRVDLDLDAALGVWHDAVGAAGSSSTSASWYHGDLLTENLLVDDRGGLLAVLDFGGLGWGNPTVDLVVAWEALDSVGREAFRRELEVDDATWAQARGWALLIAMITFPYYATTMPGRCSDRLAMANAVLSDG